MEVRGRVVGAHVEREELGRHPLGRGQQVRPGFGVHQRDLREGKNHSLDAILRWHTLVFAAYAFIQTQRVAPLLLNPRATLLPLGDVLRAHQATHVRQTVCHIAALVRSGISDAELVAMLLPT